MDALSPRARPTKLHVYVDETVREFEGGRRVVGAGALIVTEPVGKKPIEQALSALQTDPDREPSSPRFRPANEKRDERTQTRGYFHASDDSVNARSHLSRAVKAGVSGKFECSLVEASTLHDELEFRRHSILAFLPALVERLPVTLVFEQRTRFGQVSAGALIDEMNLGFDRLAYEHVTMRTQYPSIEVHVEQKQEPGLQIVDLLLWSALSARDDPAGKKAEVLNWCGANRYDQREKPVFKAKYVLNRKEPWFTERGPPRQYPVDVDSLDDGDESTLADDYCLMEREVRRAAEKPLPAHAEHLRDGAVVAVGALQERVRPDDIAEVARQFIRLFDTVPLYEGFADADARWLPFVRAKQIAGLCLREDLLNGGLTVDSLAMMRNRSVGSTPEDFGLPPSDHLGK